MLCITFMAWDVGAIVGSSEECSGSNAPWHQKKIQGSGYKKPNNMQTIAKHEQRNKKNKPQHVNTIEHEQWHPKNMQDLWKMSQN